MRSANSRLVPKRHGLELAAVPISRHGSRRPPIAAFPIAAFPIATRPTAHHPLGYHPISGPESTEIPLTSNILQPTPEETTIYTATALIL